MPKRSSDGRLPGDAPTSRRLAEMIRVNHAGEYGAKRIYQGQLAVLAGTPAEPLIREMAEQEEAHLAYFEQAVTDRGVRPTALHPLWHLAGYALGAGTALLGPRAAMACTVAVETVIDEHYSRQLEQLGEDEAALRDAVSRFREDELDHRDTGLAEGAEDAPAYRLLSAAIAAGCRAAIKLTEKV